MKIPKKIKLNDKGFTLAEVLVVIGIMVIIDSSLFLSNDTIVTGRNVRMNAYSLASEIRKMQSYTLNLQSFGATYPSGGWGIYLNKTTGNNLVFETFADNDDNQNLDSDESVRVIDLSKNVKIKELSFDNGVETPEDEIYLTFEPPDPETFICDGTTCDGTVLKIVLSDNAGNNTETVVVNKFGLIEVLNN